MTIITFVMRSTPFSRPMAHTPKQVRMTSAVTPMFRPGLVTMEPNTPPSCSAVVLTMMEPVRYLQKYTTNQPEMVV